MIDIILIWLLTGAFIIIYRVTKLEMDTPSMSFSRIELVGITILRIAIWPVAVFSEVLRKYRS